MQKLWNGLAVALGGLAACTGDGKDGGSTGVVDLQVTAVNAGAAAHSPRPAPPSSEAALTTGTGTSLVAAATHTIDPSTFRVSAFISGPPTDAKLRIQRIIARGDTGGALLFGNEDGSGPGVEITLTNGMVDLAAAGLQLNAIPVGHYTGINIWPSRAVKIKGCVSGTFNAHTAMTSTVNGVSYTTETITAGTHQFCTIAAKSPLNFVDGTAMPPGPVGTDAEYEAQTIPEEIEFDMGGGTYPSSAADVRAAAGNIDVLSEFDVDDTTPVQLTLVVDLNRMLQFWPNVRDFFDGPSFGYPKGTSVFFNSNFNQTLALFVGQPGSIEGYQLNSEVCQDITACFPGSPPDSLSREWMTVIRDSSGNVGGGLIAPDDAPPAIYGDLVPPLTTAGTDGTFHLSVGLYRDTVMEKGYVDGFRFQNLGDAEDSATVYPIMGNGPVDGHGPFPLWYTRKL